MVTSLHLEGILKPVVERVENELCVRIICGVVPDQKNAKYVVKIAGWKPGEILISDTAPDDVIAARLHAALVKHFTTGDVIQNAHRVFR